MFRKLHLQMTIFCALITSLILTGFSCICLSISEQGAEQNSYIVFQNNISSMLSHLESQTTISHQWLLQMKASSNLDIFLYDNGQPLHFNTMEHASALDNVLEQAIQTARESHGLNLNADSSQTILTQHTEFSMKGSNGKDYYVSAALLPRSGGVLSAVFLHCLDVEHAAFFRQRMLFFSIDLAAILLLSVFSWFFTGRIIRPLRESRKRQMQFIASASHELRSPLTVILSSLSAMKIAKKEEAEAFSHVIQSEGERMSRLIGDMLTLAGADNGSWSIQPAPVELDTLLLQSYEKFETVAAQKGMQLRIELPDTALPPYVCDGERIAQVLSILLDNAMSYTPQGGHILLSISKEGNRWMLRVQDNGPGIPQEARAQIFERFYRAEKSRKDKEHFGLGLCIAQEIVRLHRGRLYLDDTPGGGATFVVSLPANLTPGTYSQCIR